MSGAPFRTGRVPDVASHTVLRSLRRYGISSADGDADVEAAWRLLVAGAYAQDLNVQDQTGIPHLPGSSSSSEFGKDRATPGPVVCSTFKAWKHLLAASGRVVPLSSEPYRYDLVNLGREVLAQISTPASLNFSDATADKKMDPALLTSTGHFYAQLLEDVDTLVATDTAFLLGPWIASARRWGNSSPNASSAPADCGNSAVGIPAENCPHFYEWNARVQLTTWNPTLKGSADIPRGPIDYASKHWSGLIKDYYAARAKLLLTQALSDAAQGKPLDEAAVKRTNAAHAYDFTMSTHDYPLDPVGDAVQISQMMLAKYSPLFDTCRK